LNYCNPHKGYRLKKKNQEITNKFKAINNNSWSKGDFKSTIFKPINLQHSESKRPILLPKLIERPHYPQLEIVSTKEIH